MHSFRPFPRMRQQASVAKSHRPTVHEGEDWQLLSRGRQQRKRGDTDKGAQRGLSRGSDQRVSSQPASPDALLCAFRGST